MALYGGKGHTQGSRIREGSALRRLESRAVLDHPGPRRLIPFSGSYLRQTVLTRCVFTGREASLQQQYRCTPPPSKKNKNHSSLTHRLLSSSFLGIPFRNPEYEPTKKEVLRSLWVSSGTAQASWCTPGARA